MKKSFTVYKPMTDTPESDIEISIERDTFIGASEPVWRVSYWSDFKGRDVVEDFDFEPTDDDLKELIAKSEKADEVF